MLRAEALKLVGKPVIASCHCGSYYGILKDLRIIPGKPWRGIVILKAVASFPYPVWHNFRKPLRYNFERDFGHCNVEEYDGSIPDYKQSMISEYEYLLNKLKDQNERYKDTILHDRAIEAAVKTLENNRTLVYHPNFMGGWANSDIPEDLRQGGA